MSDILIYCRYNLSIINHLLTDCLPVSSAWWCVVLYCVGELYN